MIKMIQRTKSNAQLCKNARDHPAKLVNSPQNPRTAICLQACFANLHFPFIWLFSQVIEPTCHMNKYLLLSLLFLKVTTDGTAQDVILDANNIKAVIPSTPLLFMNGSGTSIFQVPKTGTKSPVYNSTVWIGGISNSNLYLAAETYRQNNKADFQNGPISDNYSNPGTWNVIKVTKSAIDAYKNDSTLWSNPPVEFVKWPAHGDTSNGQARNLAPFVNVGGDADRYEPQFGDYPLIKGNVCTYYIFNDDLAHTESGGQSLGIEVHRMVYQVLDPTSPVLGNTMLVEYELFNRSLRNYDTLLFTVYSDFDLGYYSDDYIGTDSNLQATYVYNGLTSDNGPTGYGLDPPVESMVMLNQPLYSSIYYNNDTTQTGNPQTTMDYWNYMHARWKNGSALTYGQDGTGSGGRTFFAFTGNPCDSSGWTEKNASLPPGDRRILGTALFKNVNAGSSVKIALGYVYARDTGFNKSICKLTSETQALRNWYQTHTGLKQTTTEIQPFVLFPNPSGGLVNLHHLSGAGTIRVFDHTGKSLFEQSYNRTEIELTFPGPGLYFVEMENSKGKQIQKLLIY